MNYAKYIDKDHIKYAPRTITIGRTHYNPTPASWLSENGYLPVIETPEPQYEDGYMGVSHWEVQNGQIIKVWEITKSPEKAPTVEERVSDLEGAVLILLNGDTNE